MVHKHYFVPKPPPPPLPERVNDESTEQVGIPEGWRPLYHTQPFSWANMIITGAWTNSSMRAITDIPHASKRQNIASFYKIIRTWSGYPTGSGIISLSHLWIHNVPLKYDLDTRNIINVVTILVHGLIRPC